jgi:putative hydrolase
LKIVVDTHTHSITSGHAYSTIQEMAKEAPANGIEMFALTDHGPAMIGAPQLYHFGNLKMIPAEIYGVKILKGVEANIIDYSGQTDLPDEYLKRLDFALVSFHDICITPATVEEHTRAVINLLKNPFIDAIGHPGNPQFPIDLDQVILAAKEYHKPMEINNCSFYVRKGSAANCKEIASLCKKNGVSIVCGSDAHISFDVGKFDQVYQVLAEVEMPEELVLNSSVAKFEAYLKQKNRR